MLQLQKTYDKSRQRMNRNTDRTAEGVVQRILLSYKGSNLYNNVAI